MPLHLAAGAAVEASVPKVAAQGQLSLWSHGSACDMLRAGLQLPSDSPESSHLYVGWFFDAF
eukprot:153062-Pyramimonas_sp.AAC.1